MKNWIKKLGLGLPLFGVCYIASAKWVDGYITTKDNEQVCGKIYIPTLDYNSYGYYISGFDLSHFYQYVKFKYRDQSKVVFQPDDIKGFRFDHEGVEYYFISQTLHYKSIIATERERGRFLNLVYLGKISLCRNSLLLNHHTVNAYNIPYHDYYLCNEDIGVIKVEKGPQFKSIKDALRFYKMSDAFLQKLPESLSIKDLQKTLYAYDMWLEDNPGDK